MATDAEISSAITAAEAIAVTPAEIIALCDRAVAAFLVNPKLSYSIAGRSVTFESVAQIKALRDYYASAPTAGARGHIVTLAEL